MTDKTYTDFGLKFTGKVAIVIDIEGFSPMSINLNDKQLTSDLVKFLLDNMSEDDMNVNVSTKAMEKRYIKIIEEIE